MLVMNVTEIHQEAKTDTIFLWQAQLRLDSINLYSGPIFYIISVRCGNSKSEKQIGNIQDWDMAWQVQESGS